jgi:Short C-terminal domain/Phospholipase_D-nuclease N-terminal
MTLAADTYPLLNLVWTFLIFFGLIIYFWLLITVFADLFRRHDVSGWGKAGWTVFVFVLPLVGALVYLISQGRSMSDRGARDADRMKAESDDYIRSVATPGYHGVDEIARGKELLDRGAISQDEFDQLKRRVLV